MIGVAGWLPISLNAQEITRPDSIEMTGNENEVFIDVDNVNEELEKGERSGNDENWETENEEESIDITYPDYENWETVGLQGKLKMKGLPLSPTLKFYMQRDSIVNISVRAPFIGEAGRLLLTPDSIMALNKMNKTYVSEKIGDLGIGKDSTQGMMNNGSGIKGRLIGNLQDLLLARFFLPGYDVMSADLDDLVEIYYEDDQFNVVPKGGAEIEGIKYGYVVDESFNPLMIVILPSQNQNLEIDVEYEYELKGYDIRMAMQDGTSVKEIVMEMNEPEWGVDEPKEINLDKKYKRVSFEEFLKGIMK